jgi:hypothetical protein
MADHSPDLDQLLDSKLTTLCVCVCVWVCLKIVNWITLNHYRCFGWLPKSQPQAFSSKVLSLPPKFCSQALFFDTHRLWMFHFHLLMIEIKMLQRPSKKSHPFCPLGYKDWAWEAKGFQGIPCFWGSWQAQRTDEGDCQGSWIGEWCETRWRRWFGKGCYDGGLGQAVWGACWLSGNVLEVVVNWGFWILLNFSSFVVRCLIEICGIMFEWIMNSYWDMIVF